MGIVPSSATIMQRTSNFSISDEVLDRFELALGELRGQFLRGDPWYGWAGSTTSPYHHLSEITRPNSSADWEHLVGRCRGEKMREAVTEIDNDPLETREWLEACAAVTQANGSSRGQFFLNQLTGAAQGSRVCTGGQTFSAH